MATKQKRMTGAAIAALSAKIADQVQRRANAGVKTAAVFLAARVKEIVSVPAPRKRVVSKLGDISYRATVKAIPGAPPRKLSGKLRQSVTYHLDPVMMNPRPVGFNRVKPRAIVGVKARSVNGFNYPKHLEGSGHAFLMVAVRRYRKDLARIVGNRVSARTMG